MGWKDPEKKREYERDYREKNKERIKAQKRIWDKKYNATHKEEIKRNHHEYYLNHKEETIQRTRMWYLKNKEWRQKWYAEYYQKIRLEVLARVDPAMKCAMCGCDDSRFLEVNHIKGGGVKEREGYKDGGHKLSHNMILLIHNGTRGIEDLNLLCRPCNSIDHLERVYGDTGLTVVHDKK